MSFTFLKTCLTIIFVSFLIPKTSIAQFENIDIGANPVSLGGAFTSLANNSNSIYYNPAGISQMKFREISFFYSPAPFGLSELKNGAVNFVEPTRYGAIGLSAKTYGFELYKELTATLTYANNFKQKIYYGVNFNFYHLKIAPPYGSASSFGIDAGLLAYLTSYLRFGFFANNLNRPTIGQTKEKLPQVYRTGLSVQLRKDLNLVLDVEKDTRYNASVKSGFEYNLFERIDIRAGVGSNPTKFSAGIGFIYSLFEISYGFYTHPDLGLTHQGSITINFGGEAGKKQMRESIISAFDTQVDTTKKLKSRSNKLKDGQTVNINTAGIDSLKMLPWVSEKTANGILEYRNANGRFNDVNELLNIKGIGNAKLEKMKPFIRLE